MDAFLAHKPWQDIEQQDREQRVVIPKTIRTVERIILEEIGQWTAQNLLLLSNALRKVFRSPLLFGGLQIVACGDWAQLPPVGGDTVQFSTIWGRMKPIVRERVQGRFKRTFRGMR